MKSKKTVNQSPRSYNKIDADFIGNANSQNSSNIKKIISKLSAQDLRILRTPNSKKAKNLLKMLNNSDND